MDDATKKLLLTWLQAFGDAVKQGANFVQQQTPLASSHTITKVSLKS